MKIGFFITPKLLNMIAEYTDYLEAVEHLPKNGTLLLHNISWDEYENVLSQFEDKAAYRISYNCGVLKIMSPRSDHEFPKDVVLNLIRVYAEEFDIDLDSYGSTTYRRKKKAKGVEADTSFYLKNAEKVRGKSIIDLEKDPPPDVAVEIDMSNESIDKFDIYAALKVLEIWRYDGKSFKIHALFEDKYEIVENSLLLPLISGKLLEEFLIIGREKGQSAMVKLFRQRLKETQ